MKPFNLEKALTGDPVITRGGRKVLAIVEYKSDFGQLAVMVGEGGERPSCFDVWNNGRYFQSEEDDNDLYMGPIIKEGWINIYPECREASKVYKTLDEAKAEVFCNTRCSDTIKIRWEE